MELDKDYHILFLMASLMSWHYVLTLCVYIMCIQAWFAPDNDNILMREASFNSMSACDNKNYDYVECYSANSEVSYLNWNNIAFKYRDYVF